MKNIEHIQHIKSNVINDGQPKLPLSNSLLEGEVAVNYADGYETISIKNSNSEIVRFSSDDYYTEQKLGSGFTGSNSALTVTDVIIENEEITAAALNDLDGRLDEKQDVINDLSTIRTNASTQSDWNASSGVAQILNKPTIPTVNDSTITITINGTTAGTFTLNSSSSVTIDLGNVGGLPSVTSADNGKVLMVVDGAWTLVTLSSIYTGTNTPSSDQGNNGDIFVQTTV